MVYIHKVEKPQEAGVEASGFIEAIAHNSPGDTPLHVVLPGGRSILPVLSEFKSLSPETRGRLQFYLADERIGGESNSGNLKKSFFDGASEEGLFREDQFVYPRIPEHLQEPHIEDYTPIERALEEYRRRLPVKFDMVILGVGEDGHVASLFPGRRENYEEKKLAVIEDSPKPPPARITLTFNAFNRDAVVVLLFLGPEKLEALMSTLEGYNLREAHDPDGGEQKLWRHDAGGHNLKGHKEGKHRKGCPASYFLDFEEVHIISDQDLSREEQE